LKEDEERYLRSKERGFLATANEDGTPTVVPVCFVYDQGKVYTAVDAKPKGPRLARIANIRRRPRVSFMVDAYSRDWSKLSYLLIHGKAELVTADSERKRAARLLIAKYPQYRMLGTAMREIVRVRVERTKFWKLRG
jgi:PPOX class probable F420-dependent enzyme